MDMKGNAWKLEEIKRKERNGMEWNGMEIEEMHGHERKWKKRKFKAGQAICKGIGKIMLNHFITNPFVSLC